MNPLINPRLKASLLFIHAAEDYCLKIFYMSFLIFSFEHFPCRVLKNHIFPLQGPLFPNQPQNSLEDISHGFSDCQTPKESIHTMTTLNPAPSSQILSLLPSSQQPQKVLLLSHSWGLFPPPPLGTHESCSLRMSPAGLGFLISSFFYSFGWMKAIPACLWWTEKTDIVSGGGKWGDLKESKGTFQQPSLRWSLPSHPQSQ